MPPIFTAKNVRNLTKGLKTITEEIVVSFAIEVNVNQRFPKDAQPAIGFADQKTVLNFETHKMKKGNKELLFCDRVSLFKNYQFLSVFKLLIVKTESNKLKQNSKNFLFFFFLFFSDYFRSTNAEHVAKLYFADYVLQKITNVES